MMVGLIAFALLGGDGFISTPNGQFTRVRLDSPSENISMAALERALETTRSIVDISAEAVQRPGHYAKILDGSATVRVERNRHSETGRFLAMRLTIITLPGQITVSCDGESGRVYSFSDHSLRPFDLGLSKQERESALIARDARLSLYDQSNAYLDLMWPKEFQREVRLRGKSDEWNATRMVGSYRTDTRAQMKYGVFGELISFHSSNTLAVYDEQRKPQLSLEDAERHAIEIMRTFPVSSGFARLKFTEVRYVVAWLPWNSLAKPREPVLAFCYRIVDPEFRSPYVDDFTAGYLQISAENGECLGMMSNAFLLGSPEKERVERPNIDDAEASLPGSPKEVLEEIGVRVSDEGRTTVPILLQLGDVCVWAKRVAGTPRVVLFHGSKTRAFLLSGVQLRDVLAIEAKRDGVAVGKGSTTDVPSPSSLEGLAVPSPP